MERSRSTPAQVFSRHLAVFAALLAVSLTGAEGLPDGVGWIFEQLQEERAAAGVAPLERIAAFDAAVRGRACRIAALPHSKRLALGESLVPLVEAAGLGGDRRVAQYLGLGRGRRYPAAGFYADWKAYDARWSLAVDPAQQVVGLATCEAEDGWTVFLAVFVERRPPPPDLVRLAKATFREVNVVRRKHRLRKLERDAALDAVALAHSEDMARRTYLEHVSPEGLEPAGRVRAGGVAFRMLGENIQLSLGADDPVRTAVDSWMGSPGHREAILTPEFTRTGVGVGVAGDGTLYFTQLFVLPRPAHPDGGGGDTGEPDGPR